VSPFFRVFTIVAGTVSLGLGILGTFLPLLPTTPFLLLAAACYLKSSPRCYNALLRSKWLGSYIRAYREGKGLPLRAKVLSIAILWATIGYSALFVVSNLVARAILVLIAAGVTAHLLSLGTAGRGKGKP